MTHDEGWQYIELGRYLERASGTAALLDAQYREFAGDTAPAVSANTSSGWDC